VNQFYEGKRHSFITISGQAETAVASLFATRIRRLPRRPPTSSRARGQSGRPPGCVVAEVGEDLFVLDTTPFGGACRFVCARRGRLILVAQVVGRRRDVGHREIEAARAAFRDWRRREPRPPCRRPRSLAPT